MNKKYDVFISYRRQGGRDCARLLQQALERRGYKCFFDYDSLQDGVFNKAIYGAIESAPNFVLILSEGALDRCKNEGDWVRTEIELAQRYGKKIIPVVPSGQHPQISPENLPSTVAALANVQMTTLNLEELFDESIDKMIAARFVKTASRNRRVQKRFLVCTLVLLACIGGIWMLSYAVKRGQKGGMGTSRQESASPTGSNLSADRGVLTNETVSPGRVVLPNGMVVTKEEYASAQKNAQVWQDALTEYGKLWREAIELQQRLEPFVKAKLLSDKDPDYVDAKYRIEHSMEHTLSSSPPPDPKVFVEYARKTRDTYKRLLDRVEKELEGEKKKSRTGETSTKRSVKQGRMELASMPLIDRNLAIKDFCLSVSLMRALPDNTCVLDNNVREEGLPVKESDSAYAVEVCNRIINEFKQAMDETTKLQKTGMDGYKLAQLRPDLVMNLHDIRTRIQRDYNQMVNDGEAEKAVMFLDAASKTFRFLGLDALEQPGFAN